MNRLLGDWFPHTGRKDLPDYGVVFLDEWNSASPSVQAASYQLACDRRLAGYKLKPGWAILGAGNRMGDGGVTFKQPLPLSNRLLHVDFDSDLEGFLTWGAKSGSIEPWISAFLRFRPDLLNTFEDHIKNKTQGQAFATERTWERVSTMSKFVGGDTNRLRPFMFGFLGSGVATEAMAFRSVWESMPDPRKLIANPTTEPVPSESSVLFAITSALASMTNADNVAAIYTYVKRMNSSAWTTLWMKDAVRRNPAVASTPTFIEFSSAFAAQVL